MNQNGTKKSCPDSEMVLDFIYEALPTPMRSSFETHLSECELCSGDVAEFASALSSVRDWKISEFDSLQTPRLTLPEKPAAGPLTRWLQTVQNAFFAPRWAAAMLLLIAISGFGLYFGFSIKDDLNAGSEQIAGIPAVNDVPAANPKTVEPEIAGIIENKEISTVTAVNNLGPEPSVEETATRRPARSDSKRSQRSVVTQRPERRIENYSAAPRLSNIEPIEEDDSLRLSDLLARADESNFE